MVYASASFLFLLACVAPRPRALGGLMRRVAVMPEGQELVPLDPLHVAAGLGFIVLQVLFLWRMLRTAE